MIKPLPDEQYAQLDDSMRFHYFQRGPELNSTDKTPVIFVHGSGPGASGWSNFSNNVDVFARDGYPCVVFDLPGYGFTSKPQDAIYSLDYFVNYLQLFLQQLKIEKAVLVGNSLGGAISLGYCLKNPDKVEKLILMATGGIEEKPTYFAMQGIQEMVKFPMGSPEFTQDVLAKLLELLVYDPVHVTEQLVSERWHVLQQQNSQVLATMDIPNQTKNLSTITCPVLGFWGTDDKFCPVGGSMTLAQSCPNVEMIMLSQCGHWVMVEYADYFNRRCLAFLAN